MWTEFYNDSWKYLRTTCTYNYNKIVYAANQSERMYYSESLEMMKNFFTAFFHQNQCISKIFLKTSLLSLRLLQHDIKSFSLYRKCKNLKKWYKT